MGDRDRDSDGRARNARPRDATGRPLSPGEDGVPRVGEGMNLTPDQALAEAERYLTAGLPFQAHEVLEDQWKQRRAASAPDTAMWQGFAQLAVGLTHLQRGNRTGAVSLLRRGADNIADFADPPPFGITVQAWADWARTTAADLEAGRPDQGPPPLVA